MFDKLARFIKRAARAAMRPFSLAASGWNSGNAKADFARMEKRRRSK